MTTELNTNKYYIVRSIYKGKGYPDIFKMKVYEVTNTTYLIGNLDFSDVRNQRFTREDFNTNFSIIEEIDAPISGSISDIHNIIMNARNYGKNTVEPYYPKWTPFGPTLD